MSPVLDTMIGTETAEAGTAVARSVSGKNSILKLEGGDRTVMMEITAGVPLPRTEIVMDAGGSSSSAKADTVTSTVACPAGQGSRRSADKFAAAAISPAVSTDSVRLVTCESPMLSIYTYVRRVWPLLS